MKLTREQIFSKADGFVEAERSLGAKTQRTFSCGHWMVYIDDTSNPEYRDKDWGISVRIGDTSVYATGPSVVRKYIVSSLGEEGYGDFKNSLSEDEQSLRRCLNKAVGYLKEKGWTGVSFVCSPSSRRLIERLQIRVAKDWAFLYQHYVF